MPVPTKRGGCSSETCCEASGREHHDHAETCTSWASDTRLHAQNTACGSKRASQKSVLARHKESSEGFAKARCKMLLLVADCGNGLDTTRWHPHIPMSLALFPAAYHLQRRKKLRGKCRKEGTGRECTPTQHFLLQRGNSILTSSEHQNFSFQKRIGSDVKCFLMSSLHSLGASSSRDLAESCSTGWELLFLL